MAHPWNRSQGIGSAPKARWTAPNITKVSNDQFLASAGLLPEKGNQHMPSGVDNPPGPKSPQQASTLQSECGESYDGGAPLTPHNTWSQVPENQRAAIPDKQWARGPNSAARQNLPESSVSLYWQMKRQQRGLIYPEPEPAWKKAPVAPNDQQNIDHRHNITDSDEHGGPDDSHSTSPQGDGQDIFYDETDAPSPIDAPLDGACDERPRRNRQKKSRGPYQGGKIANNAAALEANAGGFGNRHTPMTANQPTTNSRIVPVSGSPLTADALLANNRAIQDIPWSELARLRVPRPNHNYSHSSPSLPSVSAFNLSPDDEDETKSSMSVVPDVRNTIGGAVNIHSDGQTWQKYNWGSATGRDDDHIFLSSSFVSVFINSWAEKIKCNANVRFLEVNTPAHWKSDVNTETGELLEPVDYPDTMVDLTRILPELQWRQMNWSAELLIRRKTHRQRKFGPTGGRAGERNNSDGEVFPTPLASEEEPVQVKEPDALNPFSPKIPCHLRPAEKRDMMAVANIYREEVLKSGQALDVDPLSDEDFARILTTCQKLAMPFIVAVAGSGRDLILPKGAHTELSPFPQAIPTAQDLQKKGKILGFAYLSVWKLGLAGAGNGTGRVSADATLCVDHEHRRSKIGFSLLDKILTTVSRRHSSLSAYDFVDPANSPVFKDPTKHSRKYFKIFVTYLVRHKHRTDDNRQLEAEQKDYDLPLVWVKKLLEDEFVFDEKVRFEAVHLTKKRDNVPAYWMDAVVFEHMCYFDPRFTTDDC